MTTRLLLILAALSVSACKTESNTDYDDDGITADADCDDFNESIGAMSVWYEDVDGDGFGTIDGATQEACDRPDGYALRSGDCADDDPGRSPAAEEACNAVDDDCDGFVDENTSMGHWYQDTDGDGFGDPDTGAEACDGSGELVQNKQDCDDGDVDVHPGATELCDTKDNDCDGRVDEEDAADVTTWFFDTDGDGFGRDGTATISCDPPSSAWADAGADCNDENAEVNPGADEVCDGIDNNCDGRMDGEDATDATAWYRDNDGDMFGDSDASIHNCGQPDGYVAIDGDCDDRDRFLNPDTEWYADSDKDGYGTPDKVTASCTEVTGYVANSYDCDDSDKAINPAAVEKCDDVDNDCDGSTDGGDAIDADIYYMDFDDDGFGDKDRTGKACSKPDGFTTDSSDCDDDNKDVYPGADEFCDGVDNDCDTLIDYADPDVKTLTWYRDVDEDEWGDDDVSKDACEQPSGYVKRKGDCEDDNVYINPDALEVCDAGIDNDCDGLIDKDDPDMSGDGDWYRDADGDGHGDGSVSVSSCTKPKGFVRWPDDCDDTDPARFDTCWNGKIEFSNCAQTGYTGPSQAQCDTAYTGTHLEGEVTVVKGVQEFTIPSDGTYRIEAWGARSDGCSGRGGCGGKGARIRGDVKLSRGDVIQVVVGQQGVAKGFGGGGGGGSFVVKKSGSAPLIIAGGAGGSGHLTYSGTGPGDGTTASCGGAGKAASSGKGGCSGLGGTSSSSYGGTYNNSAGGGGLKGGGVGDGSKTNPGVAFISGGNGGADSGGFGGGGGSIAHTWNCSNGGGGGSGGGGYSGGGGGGGSCNGGGGGGGSYNAGSNVSNSSGVWSTHGKVVIDKL